MHGDHSIFIRAITDKRKVKLVFLSDAGGNKAEKLCGPLLYSPSIPGDETGEESDCYYFWDLESSAGKHVLGFPSNNIVSMELNEEAFNPKDFTTSERD
ncbi:MAG: hypothetical protein ACYS6W_04065 [Planctomycetota bacterium]|jgi:hypothetical protein